MAETETKSPPDIEKSFGYLCKAVSRRGQEAHIKIGAHIRAITNGRINSLGVYHADQSISESEKHSLYKFVFNVLIAKGEPDWSKLDGQVHAGDAKVEVEPVAAAAPRAVKPKNPAVLPASTRIDPLDAAFEQPPRTIDGRGQIVPTPEREVTADASADPLTALIIKLVSKHIKVASGTDEARVEEITRGILSEFETDYDGKFKEKLEKHLANGSFPKDRIQEMLDKLKEELAQNQIKRIEFVTAAGEVKPLTGLMHPQVTQVAAWIRAGVPVWAWSAAGSGKTHMARQIAELCEVEPHIVSVDPTLTVSKLMGYRNVSNGDFIPGFVYKPFKDGGLFAMDEIDTGDPGVVASANALLSNSHYLFPNNETVEKHPKFGVLAMANTKGLGATSGYTARNRLDAATLDRFAVIEFKYDAGLESALACGFGNPGEPWKAGKPASEILQRAYVEWVQKVRAHCKDSVLVSPRASINGCKARRAGIPMKEVVDALVFKLCTADTITRIIDGCGQPPEAV